MSPHLRSSCFYLLLCSLLSAPPALSAELPSGIQQNTQSTEAMRQLRHEDPQWLVIKPHLPNPETATAEQLETVGDVLRARRFPEDAMDYYVYALRRGGDEVTLLKKLGVTQLDLRHTPAARAYFERAIKLKRKDAVAWNNLGAVEYMDGRFATAISDYSRAIKLDKKSATFHSNLATALFEEKRYKDAREQFKAALKLDPDVAHHDGVGGLTAHMVSPEDHARYCFEMARLYSELGDDTNMLHYLAMASESGFDVMYEMSADNLMARYRKDPRVVLLVKNAKALRSGRASIDSEPAKIPPLPPVAPN
jgi:tetratricopeptide (TPR) repeat protein